MKTPKQPIQWMGRAVASEDDIHQLDTLSAVKEFSEGMPRHEAEQHAYDHHVREKRLDAAAHHLAGAKAALAAGQKDEAAKHGMLYHLHVSALGHEAVGPVPQEIQARIRPADQKIYNFKAHPGDAFAIQEHSLGKSEDTELAKETCDYTAKTTAARCRNPRSRKVAGRYLCHHHVDLAAKEDRRAALDKAEVVLRLAAALIKADILKFPGNKAPATAQESPAEVMTHTSWQKKPAPKKKKPSNVVDAAATFYDKRTYDAHNRPEPPVGALLLAGIGGAKNQYDYSHHLTDDERARGQTLVVHHAPHQYDDLMRAQVLQNAQEMRSQIAYPNVPSTSLHPGIKAALDQHSEWVRHRRLTAPKS